MTSVWEVPVVVAALLAWLSTAPTSMADAARHESIRRLLTAKSAVVYTNDNLPEARPSDIAPAPAVAPAPADDDDDVPAAAKKPAPETASSAPAPTSSPSDEKTWRDRLAALVGMLDSDQVLAASLQTRVSSLQSDFIARDDPAQRAVLGEDLSKTTVELDRMQAKIRADQAAIDKLREEGRRQGVPPGWLR